MKSYVIAVAAALATTVVAQPHGHQHQKHHLKPRQDDAAVVIVTDFESTTTTIGVTTTVWVTEGDEPAASTEEPAAATTSAPAPVVNTPAPAVSTPSSTSVVAAPKSSQVAAQFFEPARSSSTTPAPAPAPTSTSVPPPPPPPASSSVAPVVQQVAPAPVAPAAVPTTAAAPAPAPAAPASGGSGTSSSSSSSGALAGQRGGSTVSGGVCTEGSPCSGKATYYETIGTGSCGEDVDGLTVPIIALPKAFMEQKEGGNPNNNPYCNKGVTISYNGKTVNAYVFDKCPGCSGMAIDLSHAAFGALTPDFLTLGTVQLDWWFN